MKYDDYDFVQCDRAINNIMGNPCYQYGNVHSDCHVNIPFISQLPKVSDENPF